jgi:ribosomal protein S9
MSVTATGREKSSVCRAWVRLVAGSCTSADQQTEVVREVARSVVRLMPPSAARQSDVAELRELLALPAAPGQ